jgi:hypothetical protein
MRSGDFVQAACFAISTIIPMNPPQPPHSDPHDKTVSAPGLFHIESATDLDVELLTAQGCVFRGSVTAVDVKMTDGTLQISSPAVTYLNLAHVTELVLRSDGATRVFQLKNALASFREGKLTVLAESILPQISGASLN